MRCDVMWLTQLFLVAAKRCLRLCVDTLVVVQCVCVCVRVQDRARENLATRRYAACGHVLNVVTVFASGENRLIPFRALTQ